MTGNPVIREKKNTIKGCKVTIYLNEDRGLVEKCEGKKVFMEIHPEEKDEKKK
jgi:lipopolysaccharide export system protein LptA